MNRLRMLLVEDSEDDARLVERALRKGGYQPEIVRAIAPEQMRAALASADFDVVVSDHSLPGFDSLTALQILRDGDPDTPFVIVSGAIGEETAVEAMAGGAHDYVMKDDLARLVPAIERGLAEARVRRDHRTVGERMRFLAALVESSLDAILGMDLDGNITSWNGAAASLAGYGSEEALGRPVTFLFPADEQGEATALLRRARRGEHVEQYDTVWLNRDGRLIDVSLTVSRILDEDGVSVVGLSTIARDISERRRFESQLRFLADHDALTGLLNRRRLEEELERLCALATRYSEPLSLLVLDLDHFKYFNDTLGHGAGDELIRAVARSLRDRLRETDMLARLGGDEFAVLLPRTSEDDALGLAKELLEAVRRSELLAGGRVVRTTSSVGVATFAGAGETSEDLMARADLAMYEAKSRGRDRVFASTPGDQMRLETRLGWEQRIRQALASNSFMLHAQPIVNLATGEASQHELLLRMDNGKGKPIPPGAFLGIAERTGLIGEIDQWVAREAIKLAGTRKWGSGSHKLEVNLSGRSIDDPDLPDLIEHEIARSRIDPRHLVFEITETAAIANMDDAVRFARRLCRAGCGFALDDFGTGFGSFYYLKHLPLDYVKIDGDFIRDLPRSHSDQLMVEAMVQVAHGLGLETIAEFVGDDETVDLLRRYGVDFGQGYHLGRPAAVEA